MRKILRNDGATVRYNNQRSKDRAARRSGKITARQQRIARKFNRRVAKVVNAVLEKMDG